jgi:hypothetical protein
MPAINLAQLKTQSALLSEKFNQPEAFVRQLHELLDFYTNRTIRSNQIARRLSLPTYRTPTPVLRQVQFELASQAEKQPAQAIALANTLWKAGWLETRLLAAYLLGCVPPAQAIPSLTRLPEWLSLSTDKQVRAALLTDALSRLRKENLEALFQLLEEWLKSPRNAYQAWGLRALIPILSDPQFENLPAVFRILKPAFKSAGPVTQLELQAVIATLERVSYTETLAFLREILSDQPAPLMLRTIRRILPGLSVNLQASLLEILRQHGNGKQT